jgi:hypothetical protein
MIFSALSKMRHHDQREVCSKHLRKLAVAVVRYSQEHNNQLPSATNWCDAIKDKIYSDDGNAERSFKCPAGDSTSLCHYAFNARLSGMAVTNIAPQTVMLFETTGGWNVNGGAELMTPTVRHEVTWVGFADGSIMQLSASRLRELRWGP